MAQYTDSINRWNACFEISDRSEDAFPEIVRNLVDDFVRNIHIDDGDLRDYRFISRYDEYCYGRLAVAGTLLRAQRALDEARRIVETFGGFRIDVVEEIFWGCEA